MARWQLPLLEGVLITVAKLLHEGVQIDSLLAERFAGGGQARQGEQFDDHLIQLSVSSMMTRR